MKRQDVWRLLALVLLVGPRCAHVPRRGDRTTVTGAVHAGRAENITRGCEGEFIDSESHELVGGSVSVDHDSKSGFGAGGALAVGQAHVVAATNDAPASAPGRYMFGSASAYLSMDAKHIGVDLGASMLLTNGEPLFAPLFTLKLGLIEHLWVELQTGPHDGYFDGELLGIHVAGRTDDVTLRLGFGGYARPLLTREGTLVFGSDDTSLWPGVRLDGSVDVTREWAITGGLIASETWAAWIGVQRSFGPRREPIPDRPATVP